MSENHEINLTNYKCKKCNKYYASQSSLCNHNNKFHKNIGQQKSNTDVNRSENGQQKSNIGQQNSTIGQQNVQTDLTESTLDNEIITVNKTYNCRLCNKIYYNKQARWSHEKRCKNKTTLVEENNKLKEENEKLKMQIIPLTQQHNSHNTKNISNVNNGTSYINNGTSNVNNTLNNTVNNNNNNNTVTINKIGTEPIVFKTKDIKKIANDGMNGPITCARQLNFNKNKPENHSYCVTSLEGEYCTAINHKTQQPEKVSKKEVIDQVFESAYRFIESVATQIKEDSTLRDKLTNKEIKEIDRIVANKSKFYEKKNRKTFYNSINSMGYNYKELVLTTWKLLKPLENNLIEDDESTDSDDEIKEVTEFPDINELSDSDSDDEITLSNLIKL